MLKSPLRYPGGKSRAVKFIAPMMPDFLEYREPFVGGGSVFAYVKQRFQDKDFWINDLYTELFIFWVTIQNDCDALVEKVREWRAAFQDGRELHRFLIKNSVRFSALEQAAAFFIFNRISFSGTSLSGGFSQNAFDARFTESSIRRLQDFAVVVEGAKITNLDYSELVRRDGKDVFIFLDPPYYSAKRSALYGKSGHLHKSFDHEKFAQTMRDCPHKWLLTIDDSEYIKDLFSFARITPWETVYGMRNVSENSNQTGKELFIYNY